MFELESGYAATGMSAYASLLERVEFLLAEDAGYSAVRHQQFVATGYFDEVASTISGGLASTTALAGFTKQEQFAAA